MIDNHMKNLRLKFTLCAVVIAAGAYIVMDAARSAKEKVYRLAAGESDYERTHRTKRK